MKLTKWHDGSVKPVHEGVYEKNADHGKYQYWNGKYWCAWASSILNAFHNSDMKSSDQKSPWRGLFNKPK